MKLRVARHTQNLDPLIKFYRDFLGLEILGEFTNHAKYDGVFLGKQSLGWHLEFTVSDESPRHQPDEDDLLVFYLNSRQEYQRLKELFKANGIAEVEPKNPYWKENGTTYPDPDGFRVVISVVKK